MHRCPECSRHVREGDLHCPFCATPQRLTVGTAPVLISALVGLTMIACTGDDMGGPTSTGEATQGTENSASETGGGSMSSTSGQATTSGTDSSTSATSSSTSTSTASSSGTGTTDMTSTTDMTGTTEATTTDGTTTTTTTTGTGSDSDTEGACMEPGELVCDGVCVNTEEDEQNCGKCDNVCKEDEGEVCFDGECVVILPYGAPMPEPLWA